MAATAQDAGPRHRAGAAESADDVLVLGSARTKRAPVSAAGKTSRPAHRAGLDAMGQETDQARSNRSRFITLVHAATKSFTNFFFASSLA